MKIKLKVWNQRQANIRKIRTRMRSLKKETTSKIYNINNLAKLQKKV